MSLPPARIATLDLIRGVAVTGILLMNIQSFAMPEAAYLNPAAYGGAHGWNLAVWATELVLVDGKMRGLFSCLFGASLLLVAERAGERAVGVHFRRMAWLLAFGLAHLVLVWDGDILVHYALVGSVAFTFRRRPPHALVAAAVALIVGQLALSLNTPLAIDQIAAEIAGGHPSVAALHDAPLLGDQFGIPGRSTIAAQVALHRGPWTGLVAYRLAEAPGLVAGTVWSVGPETLAYMLLGMAALKGGMLTGGWPDARCRRMAAVGFGIGVPLGALMAWWVAARGFDARTVAWEALVLSAPLRPPMIAGWAASIVLLRPDGAVGSRVAAAGRMAFSNYLGTSLVCAGLFDGLDQFGGFSRIGLLPIVLALWFAMLLWSRAWLARFRYGPMEWAWRSLARGRLAPIRGAAR
ncbi:DUF418 domain-containing protein [Sphingomonas bacterium]|uniref:DUF418 domain-containing protein n=1 Tax=Sphingomonas bacterium TaxID=1895847 RepID=UPI0015757F3A|nr:DUF418 domain-containing protein [Sphingomonas bacterium]